jgi:hypothetical protein
MCDVITLKISARKRGVDLDVLDYEARELFRLTTAEERVMSRQNLTLELLRGYDRSEMFLLLLAHIVGTGGPHNIGGFGGGTLRPDPFQNLGSGRRHAGDGAAWDAAIYHALNIRIYSANPEAPFPCLGMLEGNLLVNEGVGGDIYSRKALLKLMGEPHAASLLRMLFLISAKVMTQEDEVSALGIEGSGHTLFRACEKLSPEAIGRLLGPLSAEEM